MREAGERLHTTRLESQLTQPQSLKHIAYQVIDYIAAFEDELAKMWYKPKFVLESHYVITLDRIAAQPGGEAILKQLRLHPNMANQLEEWRRLGMVGDDFTLEDLFSLSSIMHNSRGSGMLNSHYRYLPIDTKHFPDLELPIVALFDNLDDALDGWLIKSESYQALNTILPKFRGKVQTIYIDPPFNKEQDADYHYSVKYKDATWITLLENRVRLGREMLNEKGAIFVRCDYNGNMYVRLLMNEVYGGEHFRNELIISRTRAKQLVENQFVQQTESLFFYSKGNAPLVQVVERARTPEWHQLLHFPRSDCRHRIVLGREFYPPKGRRWALSQERIDKFEKEGKVRINDQYTYIDCRGVETNGIPELLYDTEIVGNEWLDIPGYSQAQHFPTENSEILLKRVIESTSNEGDLVMDFFLGSGTTVAVAHKLGRKWIGVEMGEHFYTIVLPRMKRVLFYDKSGISKEKDVRERYNPEKAGGFFKYYVLEQFEDTLRRAKYAKADF
jgi:adenine-specific DNA-methyltransferase